MGGIAHPWAWWPEPWPDFSFTCPAPGSFPGSFPPSCAFGSLMLVRMPLFLGVAIVSACQLLHLVTVSHRRCAVWDGGWGQQGGVSAATLLSRSLPFTSPQGGTWDCDSKNDCNNIVDIVLESCHSGHIPIFFQHLFWSWSGVQGLCLWLFYSVLALAVAGGKVASLPCVHTSLLPMVNHSVLRRSSHSQKKGSIEGGEKHLLPPIACSQVHQCESHCPLCTGGWDGIGDVLSLEDPWVVHARQRLCRRQQSF